MASSTRSRRHPAALLFCAAGVTAWASWNSILQYRTNSWVPTPANVIEQYKPGSKYGFTRYGYRFMDKDYTSITNRHAPNSDFFSFLGPPTNYIYLPGASLIAYVNPTNPAHAVLRPGASAATWVLPGGAAIASIISLAILLRRNVQRRAGTASASAPAIP
jgi:hypothetical protein